MMTRITILVLLLAASARAADAPAPTEPQRLLVLDVKAVGVEPAAAKQVTDAVAQALVGQKKFVALSQSELASAVALKSAEESLTCKSDDACLAELSQAANADLVVSGTLGKVGSSTTLTLTLLSSKQARVLDRRSATLDDPAKQAADVARLTRQLLGLAGADDGPRFKLPTLSKGKKLSFAVLPLEAAGVDAAIAQNLTELVAVEIKRVDDTTVVGLDDVKSLLQVQSTKAALTCTDDAACLAEIGAALGVDKLVVGRIGKLRDTFVISLRLLDNASAQADNRISETFNGTEDHLLRAIRHATRELLGVKASGNGTLLVTTSESGAHVVVDGEDRGRTPVAPLSGLAAGRHSVRVTSDAFFDWTGDVYVEPNETTAQWSPLEEKPRVFRPFVPPWTFWTLTALTTTTALGAGAVYGGGLLFKQDTEARYAQLTADQAPIDTLSADRDTVDNLNLGAAVLGTGAGVLVVVNLVAIPFTAWNVDDAGGAP